MRFPAPLFPATLVRRFKLARDIDPAYGAAFDAARAMGVEAIAYRCGISCEGIEVAEPVPIAE